MVSTSLTEVKEWTSDRIPQRRRITYADYARFDKEKAPPNFYMGHNFYMDGVVARRDLLSAWLNFFYLNKQSVKYKVKNR